MVLNVRYWLENQNQNPISDEDREYLNKDGDLMALVPDSMSLLRRFLERINWLGFLELFRKGRRSVGIPFHMSVRVEVVLTFDIGAMGSIYNAL